MTAAKFVSPATLAEEWGVSRMWVLRAIHRGDLPAWRDGRTFRVTRTDADGFIAKRLVKA